VTAILNTGVINTGGTVNITGSAVGHQPSVKNAGPAPQPPAPNRSTP
jgi:hypothetical protein